MVLLVNEAVVLETAILDNSTGHFTVEGDKNRVGMAYSSCLKDSGIFLVHQAVSDVFVVVVGDIMNDPLDSVFGGATYAMTSYIFPPMQSAFTPLYFWACCILGMLATMCCSKLPARLAHLPL